MKWFKFYGQDFLTDSKLGSLNPYQRLMWVTLLCVASQDEEKSGVLKFVKESRITALAGIYYEDLLECGIREGDTFGIFEELGLISFPDEKTLVIVNYRRKQNENTTGAERVAAFRAKKDAVSKPSVTQCNNVTLQSNENVTLEETREEENRIDKREIREEKKESSINFLRNLGKEEIQEFTERFDASEKQIRSKADDLANYCEAKGKKYKYYKSFLINAMKKDFKELRAEDRAKRANLQARVQATVLPAPRATTEEQDTTPVSQDYLDKKQEVIRKYQSMRF